MVKNHVKKIKIKKEEFIEVYLKVIKE